METNAVVLAVRNKKAVVLAHGGVYGEIPDQDYFIGQKIYWAQAPARRSFALLRRGLMIAACLAVLLGSSGFAASKYLPWTVVSVALGEGSVQYRLNAWNELLSAETETDGGQAVLETVEAASYEPIAAVMERTLATLRQDGGEAVSVEIASRFGSGEAVEEAVMNAGQAAETQITMERVPWQEADRPMPRHDQNPPQRPEDGSPPPVVPDSQPLPNSPGAGVETPSFEAPAPHALEEAQPKQQPSDSAASVLPVQEEGQPPQEMPMEQAPQAADPAPLQNEPASQPPMMESPDARQQEAAPPDQPNPMQEGSVPQENQPAPFRQSGPDINGPGDMGPGRM